MNKEKELENEIPKDIEDEIISFVGKYELPKVYTAEDIKFAFNKGRLNQIEDEIRILEKIDKIWAEQDENDDNELLSKIHSIVCDRYNKLKKLKGDLK